MELDYYTGKIAIVTIKSNTRLPWNNQTLGAKKKKRKNQALWPNTEDKKRTTAQSFFKGCLSAALPHL